MKRFIVALALTFPALAFAGPVQGADRNIVVPRDAKPFTVKEGDIVRLTGKGIAGSKVELKITDGKAKVSATNDVSERADGSIVIGNTIKEFEITPDAKGKVKLKITVTPPNGPAKEADYEFEVK
jgi:hypothetical protein